MSSDGLAFALGHDAACLRLLAAESRVIDPAEWHDALVLVQEGVLEVRCRSGETARFAKGSLLCFDGVLGGTLTAGAAGAVVLIKHRREARP